MLKDIKIKYLVRENNDLRKSLKAFKEELNSLKEENERLKLENDLTIKEYKEKIDELKLSIKSANDVKEKYIKSYTETNALLSKIKKELFKYK